MLKTSEFLKQTKALIDTPEKWVKGTTVANRDGQMCYCIVGALSQAGLNVRRGYYELSIPVPAPLNDATDRGWNLLGEMIPRIGLAAYNDSQYTEHADVMRIFDQAIEAAELIEAEDDAR